MHELFPIAVCNPPAATILAGPDGSALSLNGGVRGVHVAIFLRTHVKAPYVAASGA